MWIANALGGITMLLTGLIVRFAKASGLIAGFNTMPKEEKAKYDEEAMTRFVGNLLMASSVVILLPLAFLSFTEDPERLIGGSWALFVAIIVGGVVYANTGNRFLKRQ